MFKKMRARRCEYICGKNVNLLFPLCKSKKAVHENFEIVRTVLKMLYFMMCLTRRTTFAYKS